MSYFFIDMLIIRFMIIFDLVVLGFYLDIECEFLQFLLLNIVNYIFSRKCESDLVLEFLILMVFNEIFDNIFVFIVSFFIEYVIILDYLEYMCKIINLIFKKKLS